MIEKDTAAVIEQSLQRILADARFASSPQMSAFLRYVVEEALAGNAQRIKAYSVAVDALGKPESFDAQKDPCVRVLAMRLRENLADYYKEFEEPVVITIPRGSYKPKFNIEADSSTLPADTTASASGSLRPDTDSAVGVVAVAAANATDDTSLTGRTVSPERAVPAAMDATVDPGLAGRSGVRRWVAVGIVLLTGVGLGALLSRGELPVGSAELEAPTDIAGVDPDLGGALSSRLPEAPETPLRSRPYLPTIHIFANPNSSELLRQTGIAVSGVLSRFKNLVVVRDTFRISQADAWPEDYELRGNAVSVGETIRVNADLMHTATGTIAYTAAFEVAQHDGDNLTARMVEMVETFAAQLARRDGPLFTDYRQRDGIRPELACLYDLQNQQDTVDERVDELDSLADDDTEAERQSTDNCGLTQSLIDNNRISSLTLSINLEIEAARQASNETERSNSLENALLLARQSVSQGPYRADTHALMMKTLQLAGDLEQALEHGARAMELNPFDSRFLRDYARLLAEVDEIERAEIVEAMADKLDPLG